MINVKLKDIDNLPFIEAYNIIQRLCEDKIKLSFEDIEFILNLNEKELVAFFFSEYSLFDQADFLQVEKFTNSHLDNENLDFVSDLIYFAVDFGLDLNYRKILQLLIIEEVDNNFIVLACLQYLNLNIKLLYIDVIIKNLEYIRDTAIYHQNEQLLASLILFRITHKIDYLSFVIELIKYDESNLEFLKNTLKEKPYNNLYFNLPHILKF